MESPKKLMTGQSVAKLELKLFRQNSQGLQDEASEESESRPRKEDPHLVAEESETAS